MSCHRIDELLSLLNTHWQQSPDLSLCDCLLEIATQLALPEGLAELTDDMLIYHLKMQQQGENAPIPGMQKDCESDFKQALLKARGIE
ncbi:MULTISPECIES: DUF1040 family protein [unclassified Vibrio]|uniref:DUF1040 family protein n=1 Tax=Vibrio sp. HB236076 TaxID=3232307 RepID=A0AB39HEE4_9VIBR|nr:DUF1040 family protein [Vibrio sp. HB161653]MDP5255654.1 DUF1040 family protein [Vibrio sp. HB161653]